MYPARARPGPGRLDHTGNGGDPMRFVRTAALGAAMLVAFAACSSGGGGSAKPDIRIGSDGFYESKLVAEMYAQVLEADGYKVTRNLGIGAREVRQPALESGQIDLSPEYVGSGLGYYDKAAPTGDGPTNREALAKVLKEKAHQRVRDLARRGHERSGRPPGHGRPVQAHQDERPGRRPGRPQVGPAAGVRREPATARGRSRRTASPTRPPSARRSPRATPRSPRRSRTRASTSPGCAPRSRRSRSSGSSPSRTTRTPSPPRT